MEFLQIESSGRQPGLYVGHLRNQVCLGSQAGLGVVWKTCLSFASTAAGVEE